MDKKELLEKFCSLLNETKNSGDKDDIEISLAMFKKTMYLLADTNVRSAKELIECYEGTLKFYNFLTEIEAEDVVENFVNQDGSKGAKWKDPNELFRKVEAMGQKTECVPHFNKWALYVVMNKFASDQNNFILKWIGDDKTRYFEACYELAVSQLKDTDHLSWLRQYYGREK